MHLTAGIWRGLWPRLVYTAGCFPERAAQGRGTCSRLKHWSTGVPGRRGEGCWDGKMLGGSRKRTCAGFMKSSGRTERAPKRKHLSLCFAPWTREEDTACNLRMKSKASVAQEDKSYDWRESAGAGNYQHKQHKVYRSASLPTETIFSIHLVGLTKHHVFKVYQTLSHPRRPEGGLNHLTY